jgi:pyruvate,water dikinase
MPKDTFLPPAPAVRWEPPTPDSAWIRRQVVEHMPEPLSPLFAELYLHEGLERSLEAMQEAMGIPRNFYDSIMDRPFFTTVNGYAYLRGNLNTRWWTIPLVIPAMAVGVTKLLRNAGITYWRDDGLPSYLATIKAWKALDRSAATDEQLLRGIRELAWADARYWFACALAVGTAKVTDTLLDRFLSIAARGRGLSSGVFLRGFSSKTLDAQADLEAIAARIRDSATLRALVDATPAQSLLDALAGAPDGRTVYAALHDYLDHYGHQIYNLDFAAPTQADDPLPVLVSLKAMVQRPACDVRARQVEMERDRETLAAQTWWSFDPLRRSLFHLFLRGALYFGPYREEALFYVGAGWPTLRRLAYELGRRLCEAGSLGAPDDVFYLQSGELVAASAARAASESRPDLASLVHERRTLREAQTRLHPPPAVPPTFSYKLGPIDLSGRESQRRNAADGPTLRGFAVSPGRVTAPASVIRAPADFAKMEPGTILVCPSTTPAWTPLFAQARGLVTDIGGILAHGSIIAREYGIPAVMGTGSATQRIASGQQVTVDGDAGIVTIIA